jgi:hypothetical protein
MVKMQRYNRSPLASTAICRTEKSFITKTWKKDGEFN